MLDDAMLSAVYEELRRLVRARQRTSGSQSLTAATLVHEAYVKLSQSSRFVDESARDLKWALVLAARQILVDSARRKSAARRNGPEVAPLPLDRVDGASFDIDPLAILAVDLALEDLAVRQELPARAFELQFFGGLAVPEIAELLELSDKRVHKLLKVARTHLAQTMSRTAST
jgi:RNA polymerase sigma factor (TIGR02999 family)